MPRCARKKGEDCTYHVMIRSISEVILFNEDYDKDKYLSILKKYQDLFLFKIYSYCLLDNHAHFIIYSNGADISKIMHCVNQSYAQYYNKKYGRHGHLFQDRFKSKIVDDEKYLLALSGYIHNNASDLKKYKGRIEEYPYSSLGIFLGIRKDTYFLVDSRFILEQFSRDIIYARKKYKEFIGLCTDINKLSEIEFKNEISEYRSQKCLLLRDVKIDDIRTYISNKMEIKSISLCIKNCSSLTQARALYVVFLRTFCNLKYTDICKIIGNITQSRASKLCSIGIESIMKNEKYRLMLDEFIEKRKAA